VKHLYIIPHTLIRCTPLPADAKRTERADNELNSTIRVILNYAALGQSLMVGAAVAIPVLQLFLSNSGAPGAKKSLTWLFIFCCWYGFVVGPVVLALKFVMSAADWVATLENLTLVGFVSPNYHVD
jgi:hypothetical protein